MGKAKAGAFDEAAARLLADPQCLPWTKRRRMAQEAGKLLSPSQDGGNSALPLVLLLAEDPKWEVRKEVANHLLRMPVEHSTRLIMRFRTDSANFVRRTAENAWKQLRQAQSESERRQRSWDRLREDLDDLAKRHGVAAAKKARDIVDSLFDALAAGVVHELLGSMTPMKADIDLMLQQMVSGQLNPRAWKGALEEMQDRLAYHERFLKAMRAFAKPIPEIRLRENLLEIVGEACDQARSKLRDEGRSTDPLALKLSVPRTLAVRIARLPVTAAISDLIKNAFEAYDDPSANHKQHRIEIDAKAVDAGFVQLHIQDFGMGMAPGDLADAGMFLPARTSKKNRGTGFGLSNARRVAEAHGGRLGLESKQGTGTVVTMRLPK